MDFEWDPNKARSNIEKHGVSFHEAATVFGDPLALTFDDLDHSMSERRLLTFGTTRNEKLVTVSHTEMRDSMRIISARLMTRQERTIYEEG